jgi:hypothetical protein
VGFITPLRAVGKLPHESMKLVIMVNTEDMGIELFSKRTL